MKTLYFDSNGQEQDLSACDALKEHLILSHVLFSQIPHLRRIHRPSEDNSNRLLSLLDSKSKGVFVSPSTNPEPYREFHYNADEEGTLWGLSVVDEHDDVFDIYLHPSILITQ